MGTNTATTMSGINVSQSLRLHRRDIFRLQILVLPRSDVGRILFRDAFDFFGTRAARHGRTSPRRWLLAGAATAHGARHRAAWQDYVVGVRGIGVVVIVLLQKETLEFLVVAFELLNRGSALVGLVHFFNCC